MLLGEIPGRFDMIFALVTVLLIAADQISKLFTLRLLKPVGNVTLIKNILDLTYVENRGAAFGMMQNARWIFIVVTLAAIAAMIYYKIKHKPHGMVINSALSLLLSGAVGNMIDRVFRGFVVDMIEVTFISYPVFNIADCFVVVGAILLCVYIMFIYKEKDNE